MKAMAIKLTKCTIIFILVLLAILAFSDCKIENEKLKLKNHLLKEKLSDVQAELRGTRNSYITFTLKLIEGDELTMGKIFRLLHKKEYQFLIQEYNNTMSFNKE